MTPNLSIVIASWIVLLIMVVLAIKINREDNDRNNHGKPMRTT